ncbi:hypothetical protein TD95_003603 [Thielaviopsis punctulata]|uniref:NAD-dependent epimerase/dehydratase domain-containing protein n=1 Tax=Thielaviopsis punctulata TaxID=72032 RepID=A0A0F4Z759_9PEZI|nr:hypothetical protein TD95_003603 [Thielaviopsis punctulata]
MADSQPRVLLTGGSGFIASHILDQLLEEGFSVTFTVRSDHKGRAVRDSLPETQKPRVNYVIVPDIVADAAFDDACSYLPPAVIGTNRSQAVKSAPFTYVIHTAMPCHSNCTDPIKDFVDPAVKGTTGILKSIHAYAPTVKRVVLTSSATTLLNLKEHAKLYNEDSYSPLTLEDAYASPHYAYSTSKVYAERAAWSFVATTSPSFTLSTINNTYTFGPIQRFITTPSAVNLTNERIMHMIRGDYAHNLPPNERIYTFVDVRDVANAHVRAMLSSKAAGKRFYVVAGYFTNRDVVEGIRARFPQLERVLPARGVGEPLAEDVYQFDNTRSREILGLEYKSLGESVGDAAASMMRLLD